jgi:hypothetical protein
MLSSLPDIGGVKVKRGEPRHSTDPTRTAQDRTDYMRDYMAQRRRSRVHLSRMSRVCATSIYDIGRHILRDNSAPMYPERVTGDNWKPGVIAAEAKAALARYDRRRTSHVR